MLTQPQVKTLNNRINGLDTIRFICAMWVVFGHLGYFPLLEGIDVSSPIGRVIDAGYGTIISAPAAVIVFFVMSGLCIHYPYRNGKKPKWTRYYLRRYLRISIPLVAAIAIGNLWNTHYSLFEETVLWSISAELIYYSLYPLILKIKNNMGWNSFIILSFFIAGFIILILNPDAGNYPSYTIKFNWLVGLPCWLLGCKLAEKSDKLTKEITVHIWRWRLGLWLASCLCLILRFHTPIGYPYTLNFFAILVYFWLEKEIIYFRRNQPPSFLEIAGKWSYSIYLMHVPVATIIDSINLPNLGYILNWTMLMLGVVVVSCIFYWLIEFPSHKLVKSIKN